MGRGLRLPPRTLMYDYEAEKHEVFKPENQEMFLKIRDHAHKLIREAGAATLGKIIGGKGIVGSSWTMIACVDRLVELGEIIEIKRDEHVWGQFRIFTYRPEYP